MAATSINTCTGTAFVHSTEREQQDAVHETIISTASGVGRHVGLLPHAVTARFRRHAARVELYNLGALRAGVRRWPLPFPMQPAGPPKPSDVALRGRPLVRLAKAAAPDRLVSAEAKALLGAAAELFVARLAEASEAGRKRRDADVKAGRRPSGRAYGRVDTVEYVDIGESHGSRAAVCMADSHRFARSRGDSGQHHARFFVRGPSGATAS